MLQLREMDDRVPLADQLSEEVGPVILMNTFRVAPEDADTLLQAWAADAAYLKQQPGFISTQLQLRGQQAQRSHWQRPDQDPQPKPSAHGWLAPGLAGRARVRCHGARRRCRNLG